MYFYLYIPGMMLRLLGLCVTLVFVYKKNKIKGN